MAAAIGVGACDAEPGDGHVDATELRKQKPSKALINQVRAQIAEYGITPAAAPPSASPELVALGEALFYDKIMSGPRDVACATCHAPQLATADNRPVNAGIHGTGIGLARDGMLGGRHTQPLFNLHLLPGGLTIDGKVELVNGVVMTLGLPLIPADYQTRMGHDIVNAQAIMPLVTPQEMLGFPDPNDDNELGDCAPFDLACGWGGIMARLGAIPEYVELFEDAYPGQTWNDMTIAEVGTAIGAYEYQTFDARNSPWDRFVAGDDNALSEAQLRGAKLFFAEDKGNCVSCHSGNALTDESYHKTLTPQFGPGNNVPAGDGPGGLDDFGRLRNTGDPDDKYAWRTPPLRNVELTAPYGRLGQYTELADFIAHYHNPKKALKQYDITQLELPALHSTQLDTVKAVIANGIDPLLDDVKVNNGHVDDLDAFMTDLTDDAARDLHDVIPATVPSGLPVDH
jgi:cytochrome c peroxidase